MLQHLLSLTVIENWPGMPDMLKQLAMRKERHWQVPVLTCEAVGGQPEQAASAMASIACLHSSILLIDDMLDSDPRGVYHQMGAPAAANLASALQAMGQEALMQSDLDPVSKLEALNSYNQAALNTAAGQQRDTQNPDNETAYWQVVDLKSAPFFGAAMQLGALAGGASLEQAGLFLKLGGVYGELIQIHDDLNDAMAVPVNPDWVLGRTSLPILFALKVEHAEREQFLELWQALQTAPDPNTLDEAQSILIRCGAISYGIYELMRRHQQARGVLDSLTACRRDGLDRLLEEVILPVKNLFDSMGQSSDALFSAPASIPAA
jgi:geranylgeranyl pyrophosphate synthase